MWRAVLALLVICRGTFAVDPTVGFTETSYTVSEGNPEFEICVLLELSPNSTLPLNDTPLEVPLIPVSGTAQGGIDFAVPEGLDMIIQFVSPGVAVQCLPVIIIDDILIEGSETFQYVIGEVFYQLVDQPPVMILVEPETTTITIVDNDFEEGGPDATVGFTETSYTVSEGNPEFEICVFLELSPSLTLPLNGTPLEVPLIPVNGTAEGGFDFAVPEGPDMIILFVSPGMECFHVTIFDDFEIEGNEMFQYTIGEVFYQLVDQPPVMILVEPDTTTITIVDNDIEEEGPDAIVGFFSTSYDVFEGDGKVEICVLLLLASNSTLFGDPGVLTTVLVPLIPVNGTAEGNLDFSPETIGILYTSSEPELACVNVTIIDDDQIEGNEMFHYMIGDVQYDPVNEPPASILVEPTAANTTITIIDNDFPPDAIVSFSNANLTVNEGAISVEICVDVSYENFELLVDSLHLTPLVVQPQPVDGTALSNLDYVPNSPTLIYDNVEAEGCFSVVIFDDPLIEGNETFQYKIDSVPHENFTIAVGQPSVVTVTILDNDLRIGWKPDLYEVQEDDEVLVCAEVLEGTLVGTLCLSVFTQDGTATSFQDYFPFLPPELCFDKQNAKSCLDIYVELDLDLLEADETFFVILGTAGANVTLDPFNATVLIVESNCPDGQLGCPTEEKCFPAEYVCDQVPDCITLADESDCPEPGGCTDGDVRLIGRASDSEGVVEVCLDNIYHRTDTFDWRIQEATVVCKQLGFEAGVGVSVTYAFPIEGEEAIMLGNLPLAVTQTLRVTCDGQENTLHECNITAPPQFLPIDELLRAKRGESIQDFAGVICFENEVNCLDGDIRLVGGVDDREGQVELCLYGVWGPVAITSVFSPSLWDAQSAAVTCKQLGFEPLGARPIRPSSFLELQNFANLVNVRCNGDEAIILDCPSFTPGAVVSNTLFPVGVRCDEYQNQTDCSHGSVRLTHRNHEGTEGQVQICNEEEGTWQSVCSTGLFWNQNEASVVCRQLGFSGEGADPAFSQPLPAATGEVFPFDLNCLGDEENLFDCLAPSGQRRRRQFLSCNHSDDVGVMCSAPARIIVTPPSPGDNYTLEVGRLVDIVCQTLFDFGSENTLISYKLGEAVPQPTPNSLFQPILTTELAVTPGDAGVYRCVSANAFDNSSVDITINILVPEGPGGTQFFRFSFVSQGKLDEFHGSDPEPENETEAGASELILQIIDEDAVGVQTTECIFVASRMEDIIRELERFECKITSYPPDESSTGLAEMAVAGLQRLTSFGAFYDISVSGFCDAESTSDPSTGDYYWPEALAGTVSSQPCDGEGVEGTASRECNSTRNWLEVDASACSLTCAAELTETNTGNYSWPIVAAGVEYSQFCGLQSDVNATRQCDSTGSWLVVEDSLCLTITGQQYNELEDIIESGNVTEDNYDDLLIILVVLVDGTGSTDQTEDNVMTTIAFLVATAAIVQDPLVIVDMPDEELNNTLMILDTIEDWDGDAFPDENTSQIIMAYETIIESIALQENFTTYAFSGEDIFVIANRLNTTTLAETGYGFSSQVNNGTLSAETAAPSSSNGDLEPGEIATAFLPGSLLSLAGEDVAVVFAVYEQSTLLPVTQQPVGLLNTVVGTAVVAAAIAGMTFDNLADPVVLVFLLNTEGATNIRCVSYDFGLSDWSTEGCDTEVNGTTVTCSCNHLTNFGALVDVCSRTEGCETNDDETLALEIISIIGVVLSLVGIVLTIITLLVFKKLRKRDATKFHIQLCIAIGCMLIVFVAGIDQTDPSGGCVAVSALIHYFTLASVMWMGAEAVLMFQKLVIVFVQISNRYIICVSLVCWLAPLVPVVIPLAIDPDFMVTYVDGSDTDIDFCFIGETGVFFGAFLGPIIAVILFNLVIFFIVVFVLVRHTMGTMSRRNEKLDMPTAFRLIISISGVMFLFGLTWLFGAFTISDASFAFQLLFTIFNSLQGFFIFLFFCVLSKDAREAWLGVLLCRSKPRESTSQGKYTSGGVHTKKAGTGSTGFSTNTSSKPAPTHSEYEMPEVKTYPSELEKTDLASDTSTFKREVTQSEGTDTGATKVEITPGEVKQEDEYELGIPIKARVERHSTKCVGKHHIEKFEVDFEDNIAEDEEDEAGAPSTQC